MSSTRTATQPFLLSESELSNLILDQMDAAILICDAQTNIVLANPAAQKLYGGDPIGLPLTEAFPLVWSQDSSTNSPFPQPDASHDDGSSSPFPLREGGQERRSFSLEPTTRHGEIQRGIVVLERENTSRRDLYLHAAPYHGPAQEILCCIVSLLDVTASENAQRRKRIQFEISQVLAVSNSLAQAAPHILQTLGQGLNWDMGTIWQLDEAAQRMRPLATWHRPGDARLEEFTRVVCSYTFERGVGLPGRIWADRQSHWIQDVTQDTNFPRAAAAAQAGLHSAFGFPLISGGRLVGVLETFTRQTLEPDPDWFDMMRMLSTQIGFFLLSQSRQHDLSRFAAIIQDSDDAIYSQDLNGIVLDWNPAAERVFGYSRGEIVGESISITFPPETQGELEALLTRIRRGESVKDDNTVRLRQDGVRIHLAITVSPLRDEAGNIIAASTIARDETARVQLEQSRRRAINLLNAIVEGTTDVIYVKDRDGHYLMINRAGAELIKRTPPQIIGKTASDIFGAETGERLRADDELVMTSGTAQTFETILPSAHGNRIFHTAKAPYRSASGEIIGVIGVSRDVTELREAELAIARQAALLDLTPAAVLVRTLQGQILFWSRGAEQLYGWTKEEALGKTTHALFRTEFAESPADQEAALLNAGHWQGDLTHRTRDGSTIVVASRQVVQRDEHGNPLVILEVNTDITERKRTEQEQAFLVRAADIFNASLDFEIILQNIAELAVPFLADWCAVHILTEAGTIRRLALAHHNPALAELAAQRPQEYPLDEKAQYLVPHVLRTGTAEFYNDVPADFLENAARDEPHREHLRAIGFNAYISLPLQARGRTRGVVTFVMSDSGRHYSARDFELARELVSRAGLAADNALLYQESQAAQTRLKLLAEASSEFITSLDYETRLQRLAQLVVPRFADYCTINLLNEDGSIRLAALSHTNPAMQDLIREWAEQHPLSPDAAFGTPHVIRTGKPEWVPIVQDRAPDWEQLDPQRAAARSKMIDRLRLHSYIIVPLIARGHTFGAISFNLSESERRYGFQDLLIAEELARRAATALDNAALFQQEQEARREAERNSARLAALQRVTAAFAATLTRDQVAHVVLEQASEALGAQGGVLGLLSDDGQTIEIVSAMGYSQEILDRWRTFSINANVPLANVIRSGELLVYESLEAMRSEYPSLDSIGKAGYGTWMDIPLRMKGRTLGAVHLGFPRERIFSEADRAFATALAQQCAQALEHARLYESELAARAAAERAAQRSEWLTQASHILASSLDYKQTLKQLAELAVPELADWCQIHIAKEDGTAELLVLSHKDPEKIKWAQDYGQEIRRYFTPDWNAPRGLPHVLRSGESEIYYDLPDEFLKRVTENEVQYKIIQGLGLSSLMMVPLNAQGKTLGAITLINTESRRHFTDEDLAFAELLAERAAVAIENARLYQETQILNAELEARVQQRTYELSNAYDDLHTEVLERTRAEEMTRALLRISSKLNSTLDVETLLELLIQEVLSLVDAQSGFAGLRTSRGMQMHMYYKDGKSYPYEYTWRAGEGVPGWVMEHRAPYITNDAVNDPLVANNLPFKSDVQTEICTPILDAQDQVIGFFAAQNKNNEMPFTESDAQLLMAISPIASIAIQNAQAYEKISNAEAALKGSYAQLRALAARLQTIREEERADIARELHDELGQSLTALKMDVSALISRLPKRSKQLLERAESMTAQIDHTIKTVRRMSSQLRPGMLDDLGLAPSIEWYAQEFQNRTGIECKVIVPEEELELDSSRATVLYRIFQETLTNVARHANATRVDAALEEQHGVLTLRIRDNGQGFDIEQVRGKRSLGLLGMQERAESVEGTFHVSSAPGQGTTITVQIPIAASSAAPSQK